MANPLSPHTRKGAIVFGDLDEFVALAAQHARNPRFTIDKQLGRDGR
jgi:hypothetical protein